MFEIRGAGSPWRLYAYLGIWIALMAVWNSRSYIDCENLQIRNSVERNSGSDGFLAAPGLAWNIETRCTRSFVDSNSVALLVIFTVGLALSTVGLWRETRHLAHATVNQSRHAENALELAREEFTATHRPHVVIRFIDIEALREGAQPHIHVTLANAGASRAVITFIKAGMGLKSWEGIGWLPPGAGLEAVETATSVLESGQRLSFRLAADGARLGGPQIAAVRGLATRLYVLGEIQYRDANGTVRHTGFIRWYDAQFGRFSALEQKWAHSELEYAD